MTLKNDEVVQGCWKKCSTNVPWLEGYPTVPVATHKSQFSWFSSFGTMGSCSPHAGLIKQQQDRHYDGSVTAVYNCCHSFLIHFLGSVISIAFSCDFDLLYEYVICKYSVLLVHTVRVHTVPVLLILQNCTCTSTCSFSRIIIFFSKDQRYSYLCLVVIP